MVQVTANDEEQPIRRVTDERLDFNHFGQLRKSYLVGSSYRCGSTYLCSKLWETGVLGAPGAYLGRSRALRPLMKRFKAFTPAEYIAALIATRCSKNGVFGMKEHFIHFEAFIKNYPELLDVLSPMKFIYITREDKVAQAVSMAKALQTLEWTSRAESEKRPPLQYDRDLILNCTQEIALQDSRWIRWFEANNVTPFELTYECLTADIEGTVRSVVELLGAQNDEPDEVHLPPTRKQSDETNEEWIERFRRETRAGAAHREDQAHLGHDARGAAGGHFCDRYYRLVESLPTGVDSATGFIRTIRLRRRYDAIIAQNRALFENARVLDLMRSNGFWSMAALDSGAAHVVGVKASAREAKITGKNFAEYDVNPDSYSFTRLDTLQALEGFNPDEFDVVLCGFAEDCYFVDFFRHLARLRPKHIILDTKVVPAQGPIAQFEINKTQDTILLNPSHNLIEFLCEGRFRVRQIDWNALGITHWTGITAYARGGRRTYVLDRI